MSSIIFKPLFEVRIFHDYFLTSADGTSFFEQNEADKEELLFKKLVNKLYDVHEIFEIEPIGLTKVKMSEYKLITIKTGLGIKVGVRVTEENQAGETVYRPKQAFKDDLTLTYSIQPRLTSFSSMTNLSLSDKTPALYYFTNRDKEALDEAMVPNYSSLPISNKIGSHQNGMIHEMGAIIDFGGIVREAIQKTDGTINAHWEDINDRRFVTNADRILLPHNFSYGFKESEGVTQVKFVLVDASSNTLKTITKTATDILTEVPLNFTKVDENDETSDIIVDGHYSLKAKVGTASEIIYPVYLNNNIYTRDAIGVIDIRADEPDSPFSFLDASGFLKTRITAANEKVPHPVFEVRFKNRRTYWRYKSDKDFTDAEAAATAVHLTRLPKTLLSLKPKALTETLVPFINGVSIMLPHPKKPAIKVEDEKIFSEIYINQSNRLLNS